MWRSYHHLDATIGAAAHERGRVRRWYRQHRLAAAPSPDPYLYLPTVTRADYKALTGQDSATEGVGGLATVTVRDRP